VIRNVGESSLESVTLSHPLHSSLQTQLHKLMRHLDVPWVTEDNSEGSMKNSVNWWCCHIQLSCNCSTAGLSGHLALVREDSAYQL